MPTEEGNGYPTGVVWPGLVNITLDEPETTMYEDNVHFLKDLKEKIDISPKPEPKMSRKRFKKLLMSKGIGRDTAEYACNLVASYKGSYAWSWVTFNLLGCSAMMF